MGLAPAQRDAAAQPEDADEDHIPAPGLVRPSKDPSGVVDIDLDPRFRVVALVCWLTAGGGWSG